MLSMSQIVDGTPFPASLTVSYFTCLKAQIHLLFAGGKWQKQRSGVFFSTAVTLVLHEVASSCKSLQRRKSRVSLKKGNKVKNKRLWRCLSAWCQSGTFIIYTGGTKVGRKITAYGCSFLWSLGRWIEPWIKLYRHHRSPGNIMHSGMCLTFKVVFVVASLSISSRGQKLKRQGWKKCLFFPTRYHNLSRHCIFTFCLLRAAFLFAFVVPSFTFVLRWECLLGLYLAP